MGWFNDAADWTVHAAEDAANATADAATDVGNGFNDAANAVGGAAESAWEATSDEANAIASGVERAGITIGKGFIAGATEVGNAIEEGAEQTVDGLVALGEYISQHACDIAIGSLLSGVFAALAVDGEEEEATGNLAVLCAAQTIDNAPLKIAADALAFIIVEPVYLIPGVGSALGHKSEVETLIAFLAFRACKENPKMVVGTAGQFLAGVLIYGLTAAICEGKTPGGFADWKGVQSEITG